MKWFRFITLSCILSSVFVACKKSPTTATNFHYDYYPSRTGQFAVYDAMEISHDDQALIQHDTTRFYLKTLIGEEIEDLEGDRAFKFYRFWRTDENEQWEIKDVWTTKMKNFRVELVEENQRMVKLVFAPTKEKEWDINALNPGPELLVKYDAPSLHTSRNIFNLQFDSTIFVNQEDFFSLVDHRKKLEIYAKGVGLIYKSYKDNEISNFDTLNIRKGTEIHYTIIDFGIE